MVKPSVDAAWVRTARANRILETSDRFKKKLGDRFVFYGGETMAQSNGTWGVRCPRRTVLVQSASNTGVR